VRALPYLEAALSEYRFELACVRQADWVDGRYVEPAAAGSAASDED